MRAFTTSLLPKMAAVALLAGLISCGGGSSSGTSGAGPAHPDFSGTWLLNDVASDDVSEAFRRAERDPDLPGGNRQRVHEQVSSIVATTRVFKLVQNDSTLTIMGVAGGDIVLYHDGREVEGRIEGLGTTVTKAKWDDEKLKVERRLEGGAKLATTYELLEGGRQLSLVFKVSGVRQSIEFRRIYDAAEGY